MILVIATREQDQELWQQCLGRKYQVITSDLNIANVRSALSTGPSLVMVYLDPSDPERASFTRKLCASFAQKYALMFFAEEPERETQKVLAGTLNHLGFVDISERKILTWFRQVDQVMNTLAREEKKEP
jgi:hypothetical protein